DPRRARAPLDADLPVVGDQVTALPGGPIRQPVLDHGRPGEHVGRLGLEPGAAVVAEQLAASQERGRVADDAVWRIEAAMRLDAVEPLCPQSVLVAPRPECVRALAPGIRPTALAGVVE